MKLFRLLPLLLLGLVFVKNDTAACSDSHAAKVDPKKTTKVPACSAQKARKAAASSKADLHPDFMIGNTMIRF